ncbi:HEAT repeat domain-containing protein [Halorussus limi]|uniref:HEAT repeat domain-containing protein n=1 Tax=Halorussus limi TaxID=2938695 RepID=A0A8U0HXZ4_9EURY|nr:HEAT repeat domain-containing protein [Halorussus limi]UPV75960.1 HEAT repeat domain-containing protein [Halorussus limi]
MDARLPVEIVEREPSAVYRGTVYDQDVVVRADGSDFRVFDKNAVVTPVMVGTTRNIDLHVWGYEATIGLADERRGLEPGEHGFTVRGAVNDLERELLDVGPGTVKIDVEDLPDGTEEGDFVELRAACAKYLSDVAGRRNYEERYEYFLERLRDDDPDVRAEAAKYLAERGSTRCLDALISTAEDDPVPEVRAAATQALGVIGAATSTSSEDAAPRIRRSLERVREDEAEAVREAVRDAEEAFEDYDAASALVLK